MPTKEQQSDEELMENYYKQLKTLINQEVREALDLLGFSSWAIRAIEKINKPYSLEDYSVPSIDNAQFLVYKTKYEVTQAIEREKNLAERTGFICVNITADKFEKILAQGRFRDIFSLTEEDLKEMRRVFDRGHESYLKQRRIVEQALGIYDPDITITYGTFASENGHDELVGGADIFGDIFLRIRPEVQVTFCEGDSMSGGNTIAEEKLSKIGISTTIDLEEAAKLRQIAPEHVTLIKAMNNYLRRTYLDFGYNLGKINYIEAQIKGLRLEDIESINIPRAIAERLIVFESSGDYRTLVKTLLQDPNWKDKVNIINQ